MSFSPKVPPSTACQRAWSVNLANLIPTYPLAPFGRLCLLNQSPNQPSSQSTNQTSKQSANQPISKSASRYNHPGRLPEPVLRITPFWPSFSTISTRSLDPPSGLHDLLSGQRIQDQPSSQPANRDLKNIRAYESWTTWHYWHPSVTTATLCQLGPLGPLGLSGLMTALQALNQKSWVDATKTNTFRCLKPT